MDIKQTNKESKNEETLIRIFKYLGISDHEADILKKHEIFEILSESLIDASVEHVKKDQIVKLIFKT